MKQPIVEEVFNCARPHQVYVIFDAQSNCLYVGSSGNVKWRLQAHRQKPWWPLVWSVSVIDTKSKRDALDLEAALQEAFQPLYATTPSERHAALVGSRTKRAATLAAHRAGADCRRPICYQCGRPDPRHRTPLALRAAAQSAAA